MCSLAKTGPELMDEVVLHTTLDALLDRSPYAIPYTDEEWLQIKVLQRAQRAHFNIKEERKYDKKQGIDTTIKKEPENDGTDES